MSEEKKPEIKAGDDIVIQCPYEDCRAGFSEAVASQVWHKCPSCEREFRVSVR